jgi:LPXTG-motif cell wall-anchored protein
MQASQAAPWYVWAAIAIIGIGAFWYYARKKN